jgi:uncharacterized protein (DUF1501 family)
MNRRHLLRMLAALPATGLSTTLFAAAAAPARLLVVFLRGGYDAASLLVPVSSSFYYEVRPNIAIGRPATVGSPDTGAALSLNADWGLHPALRESVYPLFAAGHAAFVPFAGTDDTSRSHFETQDSIELGQPLGGNRNFRSGFLNRLAVELGGSAGAQAISFTDQLPLVFQGSMQIPNLALRNIGKSGLDQRQSAIIASMYRNTPLARQVDDGFAVRDDVARQMAGEMEAAGRNAISSKSFETEARRIAKLMREKYSIGFIDIGGWDTHVGQGNATGYLAGRLDELGLGLAAYAQEMGPEWGRTVVVVMSEFGRTFRENGNRGTDHGHGTVFWVLGGAIRGGRIAGEQLQVASSTLFQNRDFPVLNEYRSVLGGLFARMYGLSADQLQRVFPSSRVRDIGLL